MSQQPEKTSIQIPQPKKVNGFVRFLKRVFIKDWEIKLAAIFGGFGLWMLFAMIGNLL